MRASIRAALVVGLGLVTACGDDGTGPGTVGTARGDGQPATITGEVLTIRFQPDSTYVPVGDVTIRVYYLGALPEDSLGVPPNDSSLVDPVPIDPWGMPDSLPGDSTWPPPRPRRWTPSRRRSTRSSPRWTRCRLTRIPPRRPSGSAAGAASSSAR